MRQWFCLSGAHSVCLHCRLGHLPVNLSAVYSELQLQDYAGHGGLVVNWEVFGSGGLVVSPGRLARRAPMHARKETLASVNSG